MGHEHSHDPEGMASYQAQLFALAVCAALGLVTVALYAQGVFSKTQMLSATMARVVLVGGLGVLVLVVVRIATLWHAVVKPSLELAYNAEYRWTPWRLVLLMLPVALYFLEMPNRDVNGNVFEDPRPLKGTGGMLGEYNFFIEVEQMAALADVRLRKEGRIAILKGRFAGDSEDHFTLIRHRMHGRFDENGEPVGVVILVNYSTLKESGKPFDKLDPHELKNHWVEVKGRIRFLKSQEDKYQTALEVIPSEEEGETLKDLIKVVDR